MNRMHRLGRLIPAAEPRSDTYSPKWDAALAGCLVLGVLAEIPWVEGPWPVAALASGVVFSVSVAWRRLAPPVPLITLVVLCLGHVVAYVVNDEGLRIPTAQNFAVVIVIYSVARWAAPTLVIAGIAVFAITSPIFSLVNPEEGAGYIPTELGLSAFLTMIALAIRWKEAHRAETDRANALEMQNSLANEIHDSVAHHASAIALRSEATLNKLGSDHEAADDLRAIKGAAAAAVADMRNLVSGLKDSDGANTAALALSDLSDLLATAEREGLDVNLNLAEDLPAFTAPTAATIYRLVQESITNTLKHADSPTALSISLTQHAGITELTVLDDGKPVQELPHGHGFGLRSMTERARSVGGDLTAGPNPGGGWIVTAKIPNPTLGTSP